MISLLPIEAASYRASPLHRPDRVWVETNCYADLWIEFLHALELDGAPALAFTLSVDFEGDQWQSFKFPLDELRDLYGIDVAEMHSWRGLEHHIEEQLAMGRVLTAEADAWHLPDSPDSYHLEHVKTTILANMIDRENRRLGYFHNAGYFELEGDDFAGLFGHGLNRPEMLPTYIELVKLDRMRALDDPELLETAREHVRMHLALRPATNPVLRYRKRLEQDLEWLTAEGLATFHKYAFATVRQFGSATELAGSLCEWLAAQGEPTAEAQLHFRETAEAAKTAQFKLARLVSGRSTDIEPALDSMEQGWDAAMRALVEHYG